MTANSVKYELNFYRHKKLYSEEFEDIKDLFQYVEEMENGAEGGFADAIYLGPKLLYLRELNHEAGLAYWIKEETQDRFVEYRR